MGFFDKKTKRSAKPENTMPKLKIGRPRMYETPEEIQVEIEKYFAQVSSQNPPTLTGLALFLGYMDRCSFYDNEQRPEFSYTIKRARAIIAQFAESQLMTRDKPTGAIFWLKNSGWSDKREIEHSGNIGIDHMTLSEIDAALAKLNAMLVDAEHKG